MRVLVTIVAAALGAGVAAGYLGALHPLGDSLAVFRLPLAALFALVVIWAPWPRRVRWPLAALSLGAMAQITLPMLLVDPPSQRPGQGIVLYQQNLLFSRSPSRDAGWLEMVARAAPDVVTLQEVSARNQMLLRALAETHPHQHYCDFAAIGGVAVLSRYPAIDGTRLCAARDGLAAMQVETGQGAVWLVSVHLHWPFPYGQPAQVDRLIPVLEALQGPVILGGDFNAVSWSQTMRRMADAIGGARVPHGEASFRLPLIGMPVTIDHVLSNLEGQFQGLGQAGLSMPKAGSDHHGILAFLSRPHGAGEP